MTMNLHDAGNGDGLFDIQGKAFGAITTLNTARGTTVAASVESVMAQLNMVASIPTSYEQAGSNLPYALTSWQSSGDSLPQSLSSFCQSLLLAFVAEDSTQIDTSLTAALEYLIVQMETDGDYVAPNVVTGVLTPSGSNVGDTIIV